MPTPNDRQPGVLLLLADPAPMQPLRDHLQLLGMHVDAVADLAGARSAFFGAGGHDCLVLGPGVRPGLVRQVIASLRAVDPALPMATFGPRLPEPEPSGRHARLAAFHPGSRAGAGALVRFLRTMTLR